MFVQNPSEQARIRRAIDLVQTVFFEMLKLAPHVVFGQLSSALVKNAC